MATVVIDFYDSGILISDGKHVLVESTSCALIESDNSIIVGKLAEQQAHLRPREISTQFWSQLSANSNTKHVVSNAELAFKHLQFVWNQVAKQGYEIILVTPNTLDKQDLGLLLGICEKLSIPVLGIVNKAVLTLHGPVTDCKIVYLDILQQQISITEILQNEENVSALQPNTLSTYGLYSLTNNLAKFIAEKFIAETRFDPMDVAQDEQQFFDKLSLWLQMLETSDSVECKLTSNTSQYSIHLHKEHLLNANQVSFSEITSCLNALVHDQHAVAIICSPTCAQVFGFLDFLKALPGCAVLPLDQNSIAKQALLCIDQIIAKDKQIHYSTSLRLNQNAKPLNLSFNPGSLSNLNKTPTHVLVNNQAYLLTQEVYVVKNNSGSGLTINTISSNNSVCQITTRGLLVQIKSLNNYKIKLNESSLKTQQSIYIGDRLHIEEWIGELHFIKVNSHET